MTRVLLLSILFLAVIGGAGCNSAPPEPKESPGAMMDKSFNDTGAAAPSSK